MVTAVSAISVVLADVIVLHDVAATDARISGLSSGVPRLAVESRRVGLLRCPPECGAPIMLLLDQA
jgi:hypothetical protein